VSNAFSTSTAAVAVDVVVRDRAGQPVTGLSRADFQVFEDGHVQTITTFDAVDSSAVIPPAADPSSPLSVSTVVDSDPVGGIAVLVFEELGPNSRRLASRAATRFVQDELGRTDKAAVCVVGRALQTLADLTSDKGVILEAIGQAVRTPGRPMVHVGDVPGAEFGDAATSHESPYFRATATLDSLRALIQHIGRYPGRKTVAVFSEGIAFGEDREVGANDTWLQDNRRERFLALLDQANRAHVAFYTFDAAGLRAQAPSAAARQGALFGSGFGAEPYVALRMLADETGGRFVDGTNDLGPALKRLAEDLRSYYILGYTSTNSALDGSLRKLRVTIQRKGLMVTHRRSYRAPLPKR
jgi:VWFA-related protein